MDLDKPSAAPPPMPASAGGPPPLPAPSGPPPLPMTLATAEIYNPQMMAGLGLGALALERRYAGFWIRLAAYMLDLLFLLIVAAAFVAPMLGAIWWMAPGVKEVDLVMVGIVMGSMIGVIYYVLFTTGGWQATPGKRVCRIYVTRIDGAPIGLGRSLLREFARALIPTFTLYIGYLTVAFTREKAGLHDAVTDTRVVYGRL